MRKSWSYYNENDRQAAYWLRELIKGGFIADGEVDERSIIEVDPGDLRRFTQCHFFAGIGGWSYALRLAGWDDSRRVWTGSCPCQPFSSAGHQKGDKDERHLWPAWFRLIAKCRPDVVFGEQVDRAISLGWLDGISADLESERYAIGSVVLGAHSLGAPHIRHRIYWVANNQGERLQGSPDAARANGWPLAKAGSPVGRMGKPERNRLQKRRGHTGISGAPPRSHQGKATFGSSDFGSWKNYSAIEMLDGKTRRTPCPQSGIFPLAYGVSGRMGLLRGYGNAIVPQVAAQFIKAYREIQDG